MFLTSAAVPVARLCLDRGVEYILIDCNDYLISYFEKLGFRQYMPSFAHKEYGT